VNLRNNFIFFVNCLFVSLVFDPGDLVLGLKIPLFGICAVMLILDLLLNRKFALPINLLYINFVVLTIPIVSFMIYLIRNGSIPFNGLDLYKGYIIVTLSILLFHFKYSPIVALSNVLTVLSSFIILIYFLVLVFPELYNGIYIWGLNYQVFLIGERSYDAEIDSMWSIYFVTSPLLVIPIAYFSDLYHKVKSKYVLVLMIINVIAMFLAGTRNNMFVSILLPISLFYFYSRRKLVYFVFGFFLLFLVIYLNSDLLRAMFSLSEPSNETKFGLIDDYLRVFSEPSTLFLGQGLGSSIFWESRGKADFVTELTYLEIYRNFGFIMGSLLILVVFVPIGFIFVKKYRNLLFFLLISYFFYLVMAATNPIFFMSMGMIFFPVVLFELFSISRNNFV
jgi:hypothetical protein